MRRRAFMQLTGVLGARLIVPGLVATGLTAVTSGCTNTGESPLPDTVGTGEVKGPRLVDPSTVTLGDRRRVFASDGSSAAFAQHDHFVDLFAADGRHSARIGDATRAASAEIGTLNTPVAVAWDGTRWLVLELGNARIQAFDPHGRALGVVTGTSQYALDMAVDPRDRSILVAASSTHRIEVYSPDGKLVRTMGKPTGAASLNGPRSVTVSPATGAVHVIDEGRVVKVFDRLGVFMGAYGRKEKSLSRPTTVRFDDAGRVWVADAAFRAIHIFDDRGLLIQKLPRALNEIRTLALRSDGTMYAATA